MLKILIRRILIAIPVLVIVASLTFFFIRLAPGGPFDSDKVVSPQVMKNLSSKNKNGVFYIKVSEL